MRLTVDRLFVFGFFAILVTIGIGGLRVDAHGEKLPITLDAFRTGELQRAAEQSVSLKVTGREHLTRAYNQMLWSLLSSSPTGRLFVIGKDRQLYGGVSVDEYCVARPPSDETVADYRQFSEQTAKLSLLLKARGIAFVAVTTPSKPVVVPQGIPRYLCAEGESSQRDAVRLLTALRDANVPLVDGALLTKRIAAESDVPTFR